MSSGEPSATELRGRLAPNPVSGHSSVLLLLFIKQMPRCTTGERQTSFLARFLTYASIMGAETCASFQILPETGSSARLYSEEKANMALGREVRQLTLQNG